jgi:hypothetical protein
MKKLGMALAIATMLACQGEKKVNQSIESTKDSAVVPTDSITYHYDSVKVYSRNRLSSDTRVTDTAKAVITYPVFQDGNLNELVSKDIVKMVDNEKTYSNIESYAKGFMTDFDSFQKENPDRIQTWFLNINTKVIRQKPKYIAFYTTYINFSGGAHPNSAFIYRNYNPVTHQPITLDSLLLPGSKDKLNALAEKIFRKQEKLTPNQSLKNNYFFEKDTFKLNDNYTINDEGLLFLYNPYEIKAYAYGITKLLIPFSELKDIASPGSLLSVNN